MHEISQTVAEQVEHHRTRKGWTRRQLADRCLELGGTGLTFAAITSIESGRPDEDGRRRRGVTVDEVAVLARALAVPPVLLLFPLHNENDVAWSPGATTHPWYAIRWFSGEGRQPMKPVGGGAYDPATGLHEWYEEEPKEGTEQLDLLREYEQHIRDWAQSDDRAMNARRFAELANTAEARQARLAEADTEDVHRTQAIERDIANTRRSMRRAGLTPPRLSEELSHLEERSPER